MTDRPRVRDLARRAAVPDPRVAVLAPRATVLGPRVAVLAPRVAGAERGGFASRGNGAAA